MLSKILEQFDKKFGKCTLSLCDEHEEMMCQRCKFRIFLSQSIEQALNEVVKKGEGTDGEEFTNGYDFARYEIEQNIKNFLTN